MLNVKREYKLDSINLKIKLYEMNILLISTKSPD